MTRKHSFHAALLAAIFTAVSGLALLSCSKEKIQEEDSITPAGEEALSGDDGTSSGEPEGRQVILRVGLEETSGDDSVLLEEGDTRISISKKDDGSLHTSWTGTDKLRIGRDANTEEKVFSIQAGYTDHVAEFSGTELETGESFYVIYPSNIAWNYIFSKDYNGVKQVGNNNTDHVDYCVMLSGMTQMPTSILLTDRFAEREGLTLRKSSVIKFYLKLPAEAVTPTRIELKAGKVGDTEGSDYIFYANNNADSRTNALTLYLEDVTPDNQTITAYLSIPWYGYSVAAGQDLTISAYYDTEGGDHKVVSKTLTPGQGVFGGGQTILYQVNMTKGSTTALNTDGDGTADNPYILSTVDDLLAMKGKLLNGEMVYFEMGNDIDMASIPNWAPLNNNQQISFKRYIHFDGKGHLIKNLRCTGEAYASFFGVLCGTCRNTGFVDARIEGSSGCAGIVTAYLGRAEPDNTSETGRIEYCYTTGYVTSAGAGVGGLAGQMGALSGSVRSTISNSYSTARIEGNTCGGLTGYLKEGASIEGSYFNGVTVSTGPLWTGGIAARAENYNYGTQPVISQCVSLPRTTVAPHSGNNSVIWRIVYAEGVSQTGNLIWEGTTGNARNSSDSQAAVAIGDIQTLFTTTLGSAEGWSGTLDGGYPLLDWQAKRSDYATWAGHGQTYFDGGDGSEESPYILSQPYQLYLIESALKTWSADNDTTYIRLAADIDLSVIDNWVPINQSNENKRVNLNGNNKTLSNLTLSNTASYAGLFGVLHGKVSALTLKDFSVTQSANYSGGILAGFLANTGSAKARLKDITIDGGGVSMTGSSAVGSLGGFCGEIYASGCSSSATVTQNSNNTTAAHYCSGGLVGATRAAGNVATFENCSFSGTVNGYDGSGGILGYTYGTAGANLKGCTFSGTVNCRARTGDNPLEGNNAGGIAGYHRQGIITGCSTTATSSVSGTSNVGGIVGQADQWVGTISDCTTTGSVQARFYAGGIIGQVSADSNLQLTACSHSTGDIRYDSTYGSSYADATVCGIGGLVGDWESDGAVDRCFVSGCTLTGANCIGGLVGYHGGGTLSISESYFSDGTITSGGNGNTRAIGGILGKNYSNTSSYATTISDCYSRGTLTVGSGQVVGGIVGEAMPGCSVEYCISDCTITTQRGAGGIIGRACNAGWTHSDATYDGYTAKVKADHCICWSSSITSTIAPANSGSSGAVIGFTHKGNWMYCSYYNPNMSFTGINAVNTLVIQNGGKGYNTDIEGSTDPMVPGTTAGTSVSGDYTYVMPYHGGTVASSGRSACTVAQAIGFASRTNASSQYVWKIFYGGVYSADHLMPELRNNRETDAEGNSEGIEDFPTNDIIDDGGNF